MEKLITFEQIKLLVQKFPNDSELGYEIRNLIYELDKKNMSNVKKGKLNYDQTGRAYPDNPEIKENWKCIWENNGKYYKIIGLPYHGEWEEVKPPKQTESFKKCNAYPLCQTYRCDCYETHLMVDTMKSMEKKKNKKIYPKREKQQ